MDPVGFGITEADELIETPTPQGSLPPRGPALLMPFVRDVDTTESFGLPYINDQPHPPVPIVVIGHFDDPRAAECPPTSRQACLDRMVIDEIVEFKPRAVLTASPSTATVREIPIMTVGEVLAMRASDDPVAGPVTVRGFWSFLGIGHSCSAPAAPPGELEIRCHDGEFGITERNEPIMSLTVDLANHPDLVAGIDSVRG